MSRQYNMYNVQLSEFWKQRCFKETIHNAPYLSYDDDDGDVASEAPSRAPSTLSTTSTVTQQKARPFTPAPLPVRHPEKIPITPLHPRLHPHPPPLTSRAPMRQIEELTKKLEEERLKRQEAEQMLASFQDGRGK